MSSGEQVKNVIKTILFLVAVPGTVMFLIPYMIIRRVIPEPAYFFKVHYAAIVFWLVGGLTLLWCAKDFVFRGRGTPSPNDPPKELVAQGLYRYVRNPMYVCVLLVLAGHFVWFQTGWLLIYATLVFMGFHGFVSLYEEPTLSKKFGESYRRYLQAVPRWLPRLRR